MSSELFLCFKVYFTLFAVTTWSSLLNTFHTISIFQTFVKDILFLCVILSTFLMFILIISVSSPFCSLSADASSTFSKASRVIFVVQFGLRFLSTNGLNFHDPWTPNNTQILTYMLHNTILDYGILMFSLSQMRIDKYHILAYAPGPNVCHTLHHNAILNCIQCT